jgi:DNA-binding NarL/FixJ family response regulator
VTVISVCVADPLAAAGVAALLDGRPEFVLVPGRREAEADVVIVVADTVTIELADRLRRLASRAAGRFVLILGDPWAPVLSAAAEAGVAAVLPLAEVTPQRLGRSIITVSRGQAGLTPDVQGRLLTEISRLQGRLPGPGSLSWPGLDDREADVIRLVADGASTREIAAALSYSERTVKNILHGLTTRLGLRNRTQAVAHAIRTGAI